jgi:hypothetical protein
MCPQPILVGATSQHFSSQYAADLANVHPSIVVLTIAAQAALPSALKRRVAPERAWAQLHGHSVRSDSSHPRCQAASISPYRSQSASLPPPSRSTLNDPRKVDQHRSQSASLPPPSRAGPRAGRRAGPPTILLDQKSAENRMHWIHLALNIH